MNKRKMIIWILILLLIVGGYFLYSYIGNNFVEVIEGKDGDFIPEQEISDEQQRQTKINLYFENKENGEIEAESQSIDAKMLIDDPYTQLISFLKDGPKSDKLQKLIPEEVLINSVKKEKDILIVDFSDNFLNCVDEQNKAKIIESITKTVTQLTEINGVKILINGE